jgi:gas vesicle protein
MNTGKILLGVLAVATAGVLVGVLFAPDKGSETRRKIGKKVEEFAERLGEKIHEMKNQVPAA